METGRKTTFTVIVPTRQRADTLHTTLRTCVEQSYQHLEIIVSDNCSRDNTEEVATSFNDSRIRYLNTGRRLSMSHNFEFALEHATGDYVCVIGDDDGFTLDAILRAAEVCSEFLPDMLTWEKASYNWPSYSEPLYRNLLCTPFSRSENPYRVDTLAVLSDVFHFRVPLGSVVFTGKYPSIYHGFASRELIRKARGRDGAFYHSRIPDIYSGVALGSHAEKQYHSDYPISIRGASSHSIGDAQFSGKKGKDSPAQEFLSEDNIPFHEAVKFCHNLVVMLYEALLQVRDNVPGVAKVDVDMPALIDAAIDEISIKPSAVYDETIGSLRALAKDRDLSEHLDEAIEKQPHRGPSGAGPLFGYDPRTAYVSWDGSKLGFETLYDAAKFCRDKDLSTRAILVSESVRYAKNALVRRGPMDIIRKARR